MRDDLPRRAVGRSEACGRAVVTSVNPTDYPVPTQNRRVLLVRRPTGIPVAADFALSTAPVPELAPGTFLVRNLYLSVDPAQRGWAADGHNYSAGVQLGATMRALAVGVVVKTAVEGVREGELLYGWFGWQQLCLAGPTDILLRATFDVPATAYLSLLGINGLAAFLALHDVGRPVAGNTLLVSTAAGSVGSFVGQIGALRGCRTVGLTGSDEKARRCRDAYGYGATVNYKAADWREQLDRAVPYGVDIYFDNTGGTMLDQVLRRMAVGGRVVQCGTAATAAWDPPPTGLRNEREVLTRRLTWGGFVIFDHVARFSEAATQLAQWYRDGRLRYDEDISRGLDSALGAIEELYAGRNRGKRIVDITALE